MQISSAFNLLSTQNTNPIVKTFVSTNDNNLFLDQMNVYFEKTKQVETITNVFDIDIEGLITTGIKVSENAQLLSCAGAGSLAGIAFAASSKCFSLINGIRNRLASYSSEIMAILNNTFLSESEKDEKIKSLTTKMKALINEAKDKTSELHNITVMLKSMSSAFIALEKAGKSTCNFLTELKTMINNYNTNSTDLSNFNTQNDINDKIKENKNSRFGKNSSEKLREDINDTEETIKDIEQKIKSKSISKEEKATLEKELLIHKSLKRIYELFV